MKTIKNYIYNLLYQVIMIILPLILSPYIARVVGPEGVGLYSYSRSIADYFGLMALLGITMYGNRWIASANRDRKSLSKAFFEIYELQFMSTIFVIILYLLFINYFASNKLVFSIMLLHVLGMSLDISWFYFGIGEFKFPLIRNVIVKLVSFGAILFFVRDKQDTNVYITILALERFVVYFLLWVYLPHFIDFKFSSLTKIKKVLKSHYKSIFILFIPVIASRIYKTVDRVMLGNMVNMVQVGYYENAQSIIETIVYILTALGTVMLPSVSKLYAEKKDEQAYVYLNYSFHLITFIAVGAMFGVMGVAKSFVPLFYGDKFYPTIRLLQLLAPTLIFIGWADIIRTQYLLPKYRDREYIFAIVIGLLVNLIVNLTLIPTYQGVGAIIGTLLAEVSVCCIQFFFVKKEMNLKSILKKILPYFVLGFFMYLIIRVIDLFNLGSLYKCVIEVVIGGVIYCFLSFIYICKVEKQLYCYIIDSIKKKVNRK